MKTKELRNKTIEELNAEYAAALKEMFNLRMQRGIGQAPQPHLFKKLRRYIACIKTILSEKEGSTL